MFKHWDIDKDIFMALSTKIAVVIVILLVSINNFYPYVGHDYAYIIPRLEDTYLHYKLNGMSIQWYTPSFAGGFPAYPSPNHIQFSLPQLFTMLVAPWTASLMATAVFSLVGFFSTYHFLCHILRMHWRTSMLGALFYAGNGFYFHHMAVGHLGFQVFPLLSFILILVFDHSLKKKTAVFLLAFTFALLFHSAGYYPIAIFVLSFGVSVPLLYLIMPSIFKWKRLGFIIFGGLGIGVLLSASKISAILSLVKYFPREVTDNYLVGIGQAFLGLLLQLLGVMSILPIAWLIGGTAGDIANLLRQYTGAYYGLWELDISISPVLVLIILKGVVEHLILKERGKHLSLNKKQWAVVFLLLVAIWVCVEFIFAKGILFPFLDNLPVLGSLHVNVRYVSAFIFPLILVGSVIFNGWTKRWSEKKIVWVSDSLSIVTIVFLLLYFFVANEQVRRFDVSSQMSLYHRIRQGETFPIMNIQNTSDADGLAKKTSGLNTIEGLFGYSLENFNHQLKIGKTDKVDDGYFNMTNPASLVFPEENQLTLFERISVDDEENFVAFTHHYQPDWKIPLYQRVLDIVSGLTFVLLFSGLGYAGVQRFQKRN